ncbi:hypothetical protein LY76DRAFT_67222 [Colletotrichum caudatum]|nr:hypothetical protein LY76DRAFT_67222 [Colletotrichum caudatum]
MMDRKKPLVMIGSVYDETRGSCLPTKTAAGVTRQGWLAGRRYTYNQANRRKAREDGSVWSPGPEDERAGGGASGSFMPLKQERVMVKFFSPATRGKKTQRKKKKSAKYGSNKRSSGKLDPCVHPLLVELFSASVSGTLKHGGRSVVGGVGERPFGSVSLFIQPKKELTSPSYLRLPLPQRRHLYPLEELLSPLGIIGHSSTARWETQRSHFSTLLHCPSLG